MILIWPNSQISDGSNMLFDLIKILRYKLVVGIAVVTDDNISVVMLFDSVGNFLNIMSLQIKESEIMDDR